MVVNQLRGIRRHRTVLGLVAALPVLIGLLLLVLGPISWLVAGRTVQGLHGKDRADAVNDVRQTVLAALAGGTVLASLGYTARTYTLSRRGQITDRFRAGVDQLSSDKPQIRLGAVHSLEHVLLESPRDHTAIVKVLAAFVRNATHRGAMAAPGALPRERNAIAAIPAWGTEPELDVQAAIEVLVRRPRRPEARRVDLRGCGLAGLSLRSFEFAQPPSLGGTFLTSADLRRADLRGVHFDGAILNVADLCGALLHNARLDDTPLHKADLRLANLTGATLEATDLSGADLSECRGLTPRQLAAALIDDSTCLPDELTTHPWVIARLADCRAWARAGEPIGACPPTTQEPT